jgi:putative MATE family efflux protein
MRLMVREKRFYTTFSSLLVVISLQSLITLSVSFIDNIMLGRYNEYAMSGAAMANQVQFMLQMFVAGISSGVVVLGAQYWGKNESEPIRRIISLGMKFAMFVGLIFFVVSYFFPEQVLRLLTNDATVITEGMKYLRIMSVTNIIFSISNTLVMSLRAVETAFIGTVMASVTMVVKLVLNYLLIYGNLGFPELGIKGAALSTLVGWFAELVIIIIYMLFIDKKIKATLKTLFGFDWTYLRDYIRVSLPVILSSAMWGVAMAAQTSILGHISATAIAANSIATVIFQVAAVLSLCSASAASVIIGKTIGEGRMDMLKPYTKTFQVLFIVIGILSALVLFFIKDAIIGIYEISEETRKLADAFIVVLVLTVVGTSYEYPVSAGVIMGGGDTRYAFIVDTLFMWCFTIPLSALSAFVWNMPPLYTFVFLKADQILKCIPNAIRCNRYKWVRKLTRDAISG